jgi:hypothetical protein
MNVKVALEVRLILTGFFFFNLSPRKELCEVLVKVSGPAKDILRHGEILMQTPSPCVTCAATQIQENHVRCRYQ